VQSIHRPAGAAIQRKRAGMGTQRMACAVARRAVAVPACQVGTTIPRRVMTAVGLIRPRLQIPPLPERQRGLCAIGPAQAAGLPRLHLGREAAQVGVQVVGVASVMSVKFG
jgi:hypothetical protein